MSLFKEAQRRLYNPGNGEDPQTLTSQPFSDRLAEVLSRVSYPGLTLETSREGPNLFLRVTCPGGVCSITGKAWSWNGRWWRLSAHMTPSEIVGTAFKAVITALEHEARECFTYRGQAVYDAHLDVEVLAQVHSDRESLDAR